MEEITKTYLWSDKLEIELPPEFSNSKNKKYLVVEEVKVNIDRRFPGDVVMHADFVERDQYLDSAVCFCNGTSVKHLAKYEIKRPLRKFKIWFKNIAHEDLMNYYKYHIVRLLLIY